MNSSLSILDGCTAVITGASSGLGAEFARQISRRARCVILAARRVDRLEALATQIARDGLLVHRLAVDLAEERATEQFMTELQRLGVEVDVLVNNAGVGDHGLFDEGDWARTRGMVEVNVRALTQLTHGLLPGMIRRRHGAILNVSSIASLLPLPQMAVYAATKAYVTSLSEALRAELRGTGVLVTALCPGPVDTEFGTLADRPGSKNAQMAPDLFKVSAAEVVRQGLAALERDQARIIPGWIVFLTMTLTSMLPFFVVRFFLNRRGRDYSGH